MERIETAIVHGPNRERKKEKDSRMNLICYSSSYELVRVIHGAHKRMQPRSAPRRDGGSLNKRRTNDRHRMRREE